MENLNAILMSDAKDIGDDRKEKKRAIDESLKKRYQERLKELEQLFLLGRTHLNDAKTFKGISVEEIPEIMEVLDKELSLDEINELIGENGFHIVKSTWGRGKYDNYYVCLNSTSEHYKGTFGCRLWEEHQRKLEELWGGDVVLKNQYADFENNHKDSREVLEMVVRRLKNKEYIIRTGGSSTLVFKVEINRYVQPHKHYDVFERCIYYFFEQKGFEKEKMKFEKMGTYWCFEFSVSI